MRGVRLGLALGTLALLSGVLATSAGAALYFSGLTVKGSIGRTSLAGGKLEPKFIYNPEELAKGSGGPTGLAVSGGYIYWVPSGGRGNIGRARLDGSGVETDVVTHVNGHGIAVAGGHLYWSEGNEIARADLDGSEVEPDFISGPLSGGEMRGLAIAGEHIYWGHDLGGPIGRANLEGGEVEQEFIAAFGAVNLLAAGEYIYWSDRRDISRAKLDGTEIDRSFIQEPQGENETVSLGQLAADGEHLYWGVERSVLKKHQETETGFIGRAKLDGSEPDAQFIKGSHALRAVRGLAVDGLATPAEEKAERKKQRKEEKQK